MQNKPNFSRFLAPKRDFAQKQTQFKANSNPIYRTTKISVSSTLTTGYEGNGIFAARKTKPKQTQFAEVLKMKVSSALTRSYEDMAALAVRQNKPKQSQFRHLLRSGRVLFDDAAPASGNEEQMLKNPPAITNHARTPTRTNTALTLDDSPGKPKKGGKIDVHCDGEYVNTNRKKQEKEFYLWRNTLT